MVRQLRSALKYKVPNFTQVEASNGSYLGPISAESVAEFAATHCSGHYIMDSSL